MSKSDNQIAEVFAVLIPKAIRQIGFRRTMQMLGTILYVNLSANPLCDSVTDEELAELRDSFNSFLQPRNLGKDD